MTLPLLSVEGLAVAVATAEGPRTVVEGIDFAVGRGEALALVGESGSGKSLIAMGAIDTLGPGARVEGGTTRFRGRDLQELEDPDWRRLVGMGIGVLFQDATGALDPVDMVGAQSGEVLEEHVDLTRDEIRRRVLDALGEVKLPKGRNYVSFAHEMSRGQAQRAMLAAALLSAPELLIADEPLSGLDVTIARAIVTLIDDMRRKRGMGLLFVTHDLGVVASLADRVAIVYGGMIVEDAPVGVVYRRPRHPYTDGLLGSMPGLPRDRLRPVAGDPPELTDVPQGCPFAPRCEYTIAACRMERPRLRQVGDSRVACIRAEELSLAGIGG